MPSLLKDITAEVHGNTAGGIHPTVLALVDAFLTYLREPRYQNPLSLNELANLFQSFYSDLNSLVLHIYTQLNTNKRLLLQKLAIFAGNLDCFDYLVAIANYSSSSIKLVKRTDPDAMSQLRVFAYYKLLTILDTVEKAQYDLFSTPNPGDKSTLYDKIFGFNDRDIKFQRLFSEKIKLLRNLNLSFGCFCDTNDADEKAKLDEFFLTFHLEENPTLTKIQSSLRLMNQVRTPSAKLKHIVKTQKLLIVLLSAFYDNDTTKVNNDILLPALIYIIIYHLEEPNEESDEDTESSDHNIYLNFTFVKNFLNSIDPYTVDCSTFTLSSSLLSYNPTDHRKSITRNDRKLSNNLYELLNLTEAVEEEKESEPFLGISELKDDQSLINYMQHTFMNNGEHQYYLTNFEAIIYFLLNTPVSELVPEDFTLPEIYTNSPHITSSLHDIIEISEKRRSQLLDERPLEDEMSKLVREELDGNRQRSSSLFNTITSAMAHSVNRSRSNSALKSPTKEDHLDFESSIYTSPLASSDKVDNSGLGKVRNILGRLGLTSNTQARPATLDEEIESADIEELNLDGVLDFRHKRSVSLFDKLSPNQSRTRSGSLEAAMASMVPPNSALRKATLTSKFSSGVSEFMTKFSTAVPSSGLSTLGTVVGGHQLSVSLHSIDDNSPFEDPATFKRPEIGKRTSSIQTMDRWFNNITGSAADNVPGHHASGSNASHQYTTADSNYNEGSVFSASFGELTKYQHVDFELLTINDLKTLKGYYDQLCSEVMSVKNGSKTSNEFLAEDDKDGNSL